MNTDPLPAIASRKLRQRIQQIEAILQQNAIPLPDRDLILKRSLKESWFLDTLAWLLDPKGSHGLGVAFAKQFLRAIAKERTNGLYRRRQAFLKWGKTGHGTGTSKFRLSNASTIREFYFPPSAKDSSIGARYCDLGLLDLDSKDSIIIVIEGKLFSSNRPAQLSNYFLLTEEKYARVHVREYVYLSLYGRPPEIYDGEDKRSYHNWVTLSWTDHILSIAQELSPKCRSQNLLEFEKLLIWLKSMGQVDSGMLRAFRDDLTTAVSDCLLEELQRLNEGKRGTWRRKSDSLHTLQHSSTPSRDLRIGLLPNMSIAVQGWHDGKPQFGKILIPFGANVRQIFNLIDITARSIYYLYFDNDRMQLYLNDRRRLTRNLSRVKKHYQSLFKMAYLYQQELSALMAASDEAWEEQRRAEEFSNKT